MGSPWSGTGGPCGIHVLLEHAGGDETLYCHLSEMTVREGQVVGAGQRIGSVGARGFATGPHLHFEVHSGSRPVDPVAWLQRSPTTTVNHFGGR
jgi:murein DD-endopeptidase MepM/ murein hydrolase activator NlpD